VNTHIGFVFLELKEVQ